MTLYLWITASIFYLMAFSKLFLYAAVARRGEMTGQLRAIILVRMLLWAFLATVGFYYVITG